MKIENNHIGPLSGAKAADIQPKGSTTKTGKSTASGGRKDVANVSEQGRLLAKARTALADTPEVRAELVNSVKKSIEDGSYTINAEKLATAILKQMNFE